MYMFVFAVAHTCMRAATERVACMCARVHMCVYVCVHVCVCAGVCGWVYVWQDKDLAQGLVTLNPMDIKTFVVTLVPR